MKNKKTYIRLSVKTNIIIKTLDFNNPVNVIFLCEIHMFFVRHLWTIHRM